MVRHAVNNVPYYERLFRDRKLVADDIRTVADLVKLPILRKDTIRQHPELFLARNASPKDYAFVSTSGTSGHSIRIATPLANEHFLGGPFEWRFYRWGGYQPDDPCAVFRAHYIPSQGEPLHCINPVQNKDYFSIFQLTEKNVMEYVEGLRKFNPLFMNAYASILMELVHLLCERNIGAPIQPKAIFTIGEYVPDMHRRVIESYFGCRIFDWYGMEERAVIAAECEHHTNHHVFSDYGIVELVDDETPTPESAKCIIATSLTNWVFPLIRYDTEDSAHPVETPCSCGRGFPLIRIAGDKKRVSIIDHNGWPLSLFGALEHSIENIRQHQYVLHGPGQVTLRVVKGKSYEQSDETRLKKNLETIFNDRVDFDIEYVDFIQRTPGGKVPLAMAAAPMVTT